MENWLLNIENKSLKKIILETNTLKYFCTFENFLRTIRNSDIANGNMIPRSDIEELYKKMKKENLFREQKIHRYTVTYDNWEPYTSSSWNTSGHHAGTATYNMYRTISGTAT